MCAAVCSYRKRRDFDPTRRGILDPKALDLAARAEAYPQNPAYGQIICRCESVTEGEIIDAIHRTPGARSLDGVKRRTRAGMGRCQAGFCSPRVMEILARELGVAAERDHQVRRRVPADRRHEQGLACERGRQAK